MLAEEYNVKYNTILNSFSQLRLWRANNVRWGMKGDTHMNDSLRLFLYLRTLNRYSPGINLCDSDLNILFKNALTLTSGLKFLKIEGGISRIQPIDTCGCKCGQSIVNIISNITNGGFNEDRLFFTTTDLSPTLVIDDYHNTYFPLYGNNPKLKLYDDSGTRFIGELETPERIEYEDDDPNKNILRITWEFPYGISGFVQIIGSSTGSSGGSGGATPGILTYSQANLLENSPGDGNWYLPLVLAANKRPYFVLSNNVEVTTRYDKSLIPARLYGFSSNNTQTIQISII